MVVYVDMLIILNFITDYFLLKVTAGILKVFVPLWRTVLSAFLASLFSLYIFLPQSGILIQIAVRLIFCAAITLLAFGFKDVKFYIKAALLFFGVTFAFAGAMWAFYAIFKPQKMAVKNSVVYFDISPLVLIVSSVAFYFILELSRLVLRRGETSETFAVTLVLGEAKKTFSGIADTGNNLRDPFNDRSVIIVNREDIAPLFEKNIVNKTRFCLLPCNTVTGAALLEGYRLDAAQIKFNSKTVRIKGIIAAFANEKIEKDTAIINPDIL